MLQLEILIVKLLAIDRLSTSAVEVCKVTTLDHERLDDAVKNGTF